MSPHGFTRRPRPADLAAWRALVEGARAAAARPLDPHKRLLKLATKADKAVLPVDHQRPDSPFVALVRLAKGWGLMTLVERNEHAGELAGLVDQVDAALPATAVERPPTPNRVRADIDG